MKGVSGSVKAAVSVFLLLTFILYLVPLYVMVNQSLKSYETLSRATMWNLPEQVSLEGIRKAWATLRPNLLNSAYMAIPATLITCILGAFNGFVLSKWRFRGDNLVFAFLLFGMFIPYQSVLIPLVIFLQQIGLYNTLAGLVLVHSVYGIPIPALIFRTYFSAIPDELTEAAKVDGAGLFRTFWNIMAPLVLPAFGVVAIFNFTNIWNDFLFAVVTIPSARLQPVMVAVYNLAGSFVVEWNVQMAGALLAALPTLILYILLGRFFISGLLAGSVKG